MLFAVIFADKPGRGELRATHLQDHIAWVDAHKDRVLVAGSLREECLSNTTISTRTHAIGRSRCEPPRVPWRLVGLSHTGMAV